MNYGKTSLNKEKNNLTSAKKHKSPVVVGVKIFFFAALIVCVGVGTVAFKYAKDLIDTLPDVATIDISPTGYMSKVYDRDGVELETLAASGANRSYVSIDKIPLDLQHAFVAIEDSRFYEHNGIDIQGIIRAGVDGITNGFHFSQGASTLTQQLLKNNYFTTWTSETGKMDSVNRKIKEQYFAVQLEKITSKDVILENYLNSINLGQNTLGVEAASQRYFNKPVSELTLSECTVIAGITQNPTKYNPISHPDDNATRRKKVLKNMLDQGYITQSEYNTALSDDVYSRIATVNTEITSSSSTSYFVDAVTDEVLNDLKERLSITDSEAQQLLYSGGLQIYTTMDSRIQGILDREISNINNYDGTKKISFSYRLTVKKADGSTKNYSEQTMLNYYRASNSYYNINFNSQEDADAAIEKYKAAIMEPGDEIAPAGETITYTLQPQAAMTIIQQSTGEVVALSGGRGEKTGSRTLNRATNTTRQPGSTFKIIAAYSPALDSKGRGLGTVADDAPFQYRNGPVVNNVDLTHGGLTNYRKGIVDSNNIVAIKAFTDAGASVGYKYAKAYGISTLVEGDINQAMAIGGVTNGVKNIEMCGAYAAIANEGYYIEPHLYTRITDRQGNVLIDRTYNEETQVIKESTAWLLTSAMQDVMKASTGTRANFTYTFNTKMPVAGKSGTTNGRRDVTFAGFTPYYTAFIWGGFDDNSKQDYIYHSKNIWREVMGKIHEDLPVIAFPSKPSNIIEVTVCKKSGMLAVPGVCDCDPRGSMIYSEFYEEGTEPTERCNRHAWLSVCRDTGYLAREGCTVDHGLFIVGGTQGTDDAQFAISLESATHYCPYHEGSTMCEIPNVTGIVETILPSADAKPEEGADTEAQEADTYTAPGVENGVAIQQPTVSVTENTLPH